MNNKKTLSVINLDTAKALFNAVFVGSTDTYASIPTLFPAEHPLKPLFDQLVMLSSKNSDRNTTEFRALRALAYVISRDLNHNASETIRPHHGLSGYVTDHKDQMNSELAKIFDAASQEYQWVAELIKR